MKIRKMMKGILMAALTGITLLCAIPVAADMQEDTAKEFREIQENIINWKNDQNGQETLLAGDLIDYAGQAGSDWYAFTAGRMGMTDGKAAYLSRLQDHVEEIYANLEDNISQMRATDWHRMALAVSACGGDPTAFGTDAEGNPINLVADGTWNCLTGDPGKQGINGYSWALYLMDSKNYEVPADAKWTREMILDSILEKQFEDGGFALGNVDSSDADVTSIVLTALAPYASDPEVQAAADAAFARLSEIQQEDGTMVTYGERTSESTAWTLIALSAWNKNALTDELFIKNGNTLYDGLKLFMLEDGSFVHSLDGPEPETEGNSVSMYQVLYAIEAGCRQLEGKNRLFDLTDAEAVTQEEIDAAGQALPELTDGTEGAAESAEEDGMSRLTLIVIGAAVVVLAVVVLLLVLMKDKKKTKDSQQFVPDDDEW